MPEPNFIDHVKLYMRAGKGGAGSVHFRRARYIPKGGPDGGDGGRGGHIILQGEEQLSTLLHLRYTKHVRAEHGGDGEGKNCTGADGKDILIKVPLGTVAKDADSGEFLAEITEHGQQQLLLRGGKGGLGNTQFKSATQQAPRYAQPGKEGEEKAVILELKLIAEAGLIGTPNAGKSTLLSTISAAKPVIADYPFTTLTPQLGIVSYQTQTRVVAEIPGLIQGAAQGKGLGTRFLRHAERTQLLLIVIPADTPDYRAHYELLYHELHAHNPSLVRKKQLIIISKIDCITPEVLDKRLKTLPAEIPYIPLSSHTHTGINQLKQKLVELI